MCGAGSPFQIPSPNSRWSGKIKIKIKPVPNPHPPCPRPFRTPSGSTRGLIKNVERWPPRRSRLVWSARPSFCSKHLLSASSTNAGAGQGLVLGRYGGPPLCQSRSHALVLLPSLYLIITPVFKVVWKNGRACVARARPTPTPPRVLSLPSLSKQADKDGEDPARLRIVHPTPPTRPQNTTRSPAIFIWHVMYLTCPIKVYASGKKLLHF